MHLVVITGMSGAGKSYALNVLEDMEYYCIDNMPPLLIGEFVKLYENNEEKKNSNIAVGVDIRGGEFFYELGKTMEALKQKGIKIETLFLEADDKSLIKDIKKADEHTPYPEAVECRKASIKNAK